MTTILEKFYILDYPFDNQAEILVGRRFLHAIGGTLCTKERATSFFDGKCHQSFKTIKQETEGNGLEVNETTYIEPLYPFDCCIQTEVNRQLQTIVNPLREAKFWERTIRLLGTLPVNLEWKPCFQRCHSNEEEATGKWKIEIRLTDPYGNVYMQGFTTTRRLSRYKKLSDIIQMSDDAGSSSTKSKRARIATPQLARPTTTDMNDKIERLETHVRNIEGMIRRQSYHLDRYAAILEHIGAKEGITFKEPYNPPNYAEEQHQNNE
ncbi:hypothetical protein Tco_0045053 [Tanacetum coccineum]